MSKNLQDDIEKLIDEAESADIKSFTFELINAVWAEFCDIDPEDIEKPMVEAYLQETDQSLEIFNPELKTDLVYMYELKTILEKYLG